MKKCCYTQSKLPWTVWERVTSKSGALFWVLVKKGRLLQGRIWNWEMEKWRPRCDGHKNESLGHTNGLVMG